MDKKLFIGLNRWKLILSCYLDIDAVLWDIRDVGRCMLILWLFSRVSESSPIV